MTGFFYLDWSLLSVSLFNAILMLWLGLTVLLNARHRAPESRSGAWGFWIAAGSLLLGGVFFLLHSALLGFDIRSLLSALNIWWRAGWITAAILPFAWYAVMLWYAGFWEEGSGNIFLRHRPWFLFSASSALAWVYLALAANPPPTISGLSQYESASAFPGGSFPGVMLAYPLFIVVYMGLAFDALRRPGPTARLMGGAARLRARPWLTAASLAFLGVCLLVGLAELWVLLNVNARSMENFLIILGGLDLAIAALIGLAVLLLGQAIVAYEIFTGRILPRRGLARYWRNAVVLAGGYSLIVGWSLTSRLTPVYILLLATVVTTVFYALMGRRSYTERDSFLETLRPFVSSQQLYERLTAESPAPWDTNALEPFRTLCSDVLGCERAALAAVGPMAPFWGPPLSFPASFSGAASSAEIPAPPSRSEVLPLAADRTDRLRWAAGLWSRRGPIGVLLLGDKLDGSLYTQEDFEIAQAVCERLVDAQTGAELARRLISIQRERLIGSQVLDRKTRRVLHDEILPALHADLLALNARAAPDAQSAPALADLAQIHRRISQLLIDMPRAQPSDQPVQNILDSLRRLLTDELKQVFDSVSWEIDPLAEQASKNLPPMFVEVLFYAAREAVRNAAKYGRGSDASRALQLRISLRGIETLELDVEDDGVGISSAEPNQNGTGQGLALHGTLMALIGGRLIVERATAGGTAVRLVLPQKAAPSTQVE
jgi:two-component sensor histidine kinase